MTYKKTLLCLGQFLAVMLGAVFYSAMPTSAQAHAITFEIHSRAPGHADFHLFGTFQTHGSASTIRLHLESHGFHVDIRQSRRPIPRFEEFLPFHAVHEDHVISHSKAVEVFNWMARQHDIAYRYPVDGCYARAELMIERMRKQGFHPHRVWSVANGEPLHTRSRNARAGFVEWGYHVAPVLYARGTDGRKHWYVIDPSMFHEPVTIASWRNAQMKTSRSHRPFITMTSVGEAPMWNDHHRKPGHGYWPGADPKNGMHTHAVDTMKRYLPLEGRAALDPFGPRDFALTDRTADRMAF